MPWLAIGALIVIGALIPATASAREQVRLERLPASEVLSAGEVPRERVGPPPRVIELRVPDPERLKNEKARAAREQARRSPLLPGPSAAPSGEDGPTPSAAVFDDLNELGLVAGNSTPPDTTGAIGPSHYVEMVNREVGVFGRADLGLIATTGQSGLDDFVGAPGSNVFDPQIQWDPEANRWLYAADRVVGVGDNFIAFGWSKTADPTPLGTGGSSGNWCRFFIDTDAELDDYPKLGHNDNHIIIGTNVFDDSGGSNQDQFLTSRIWAIPKPADGDTSCTSPAAFSAGSPASPLETADGNPVFTPVPANTFESAANGYVVAADSPFDVANPSQVMAWHVSGPSGAPSLSEDGNMNVSTFDFPANVPQPGPPRVLDSLDARLTQAVARTDPAAGEQAVWTQHTVDGPGGRAVVRWYELLPGSTAVRQEGTISDPSHFVFNGAISPTSDGASAAIDYNVGSSSLLAQIRARSREAPTPLDQMVGEVTLGDSAAATKDFTCNPGPCRWGDYAGASPDPASAALVWGSNQLSGPADGTNPHWVTRNFALTVEGAPPDTSPPDTSIDSGPAEGSSTNDPTPTFTFSSTEANSTFECRVDSDAFGACSGPGGSHTPPAPLPDGSHTFEVRATDTAGNTDQSPASRSFTVDTVDPETQIDGGPVQGSTTNDNTPTFAFSSSEPNSSFECRVDGGGFSGCTSPHTTEPLPDGERTFEVRAIDEAGNPDPSPAGRTFTVDATPPDTQIDSGPDGPTNDATPIFTFSSTEANSTFACRVDSDPFGACSGPGGSHTPPAPLPDGSHTFEVRAIDQDGNPDPSPALRSFTVDTTPPAPTPPPDTQPPDGDLSGKKKQKAGKPIEVEVSCDEDCTVVAEGKVMVGGGARERGSARAAEAQKPRFMLNGVTEELAGGETATLKLKPKGRKSARKLRGLVKRGTKATVKIEAAFTDRAGNTTTENLSVKLKRR